MIELKEHNVRPYQELCEMLEKHNKVAYVSATGTGKSYVVGKYIEEHGLVDKTLVLVPSKAIEYNWKCLLPELDVMTYQALARDKPWLKKTRLIVCDEMHHLGACKWGEALEKTISEYGGLMIGLSATPIRYLDNQRDMVSEIFDGIMVSGMELPEAISRGVLPSFDYVSALYDLPSKIPDDSKKNEITENLFHQLDVLSSRYSFQSILKKHLQNKVYKVAVFVNRISELPKIMKMVQEIYPDAGHYIADSEMRASKIQEIFDLFRNDCRLSFLYTVDLLNEGIHINGVNVVIMFRKTKSPIIYLQQIGRGLSTNGSGQRVKIFDFVANHINLKSYKRDKGSTIQWIMDGIEEPNRQIIVSDYTLEELELLEKISDTFLHRWDEKEDEILRRYYQEKNGMEMILKILPDRSVGGIKNRAKILGLWKTAVRYPPEFEEVVKEHYFEENGMDKILEKYPYATPQAVRRYAIKLGLHEPNKNNKWTRWTDAEKNILKDNASATDEELQRLIPNKTLPAINAKRSELKLKRKKKYWTRKKDSILEENLTLTDAEIQRTFFPDISLSAVSGRRRKLGLKKPDSRRKQYIADNDVDLFRELYISGGTKWVQDEPKFSHLTKSEISKIAETNHFRRNGGCVHINWSKQEIEAIEAELIQTGNRTEAAKKVHLMFPDRSVTAIVRKIDRMKNREANHA